MKIGENINYSEALPLTAGSGPIQTSPSIKGLVLIALFVYQQSALKKLKSADITESRAHKRNRYKSIIEVIYDV